LTAKLVELADTPSDAIMLAILYNLLMLQLLPFASITSNDPRMITFRSAKPVPQATG
jgi:hypothetical protein